MDHLHIIPPADARRARSARSPFFAVLLPVFGSLLSGCPWPQYCPGGYGGGETCRADVVATAPEPFSSALINASGEDVKLSIAPSVLKLSCGALATGSIKQQVLSHKDLFSKPAEVQLRKDGAVSLSEFARGAADCTAILVGGERVEEVV